CLFVGLPFCVCACLSVRLYVSDSLHLNVCISVCFFHSRFLNLSALSLFQSVLLTLPVFLSLFITQRACPPPPTPYINNWRLN
uniref:Uncharacterized protein n=1 Tax=Esox lucius TaxID=8010 RepID=A0AAY5KTZ5_ESOLU